MKSPILEKTVNRKAFMKELNEFLKKDLKISPKQIDKKEKDAWFVSIDEDKDFVLYCGFEYDQFVFWLMVSSFGGICREPYTEMEKIKEKITKVVTGVRLIKEVI